MLYLISADQYNQITRSSNCIVDKPIMFLQFYNSPFLYPADKH